MRKKVAIPNSSIMKGDANMEENRKMQALDDSNLESANGGVGGGESYKKVYLWQLSTNEMSYYLMGQCPYPKCNHSNLTPFGDQFGCSGCMIIFVA